MGLTDQLLLVARDLFLCYIGTASSISKDVIIMENENEQNSIFLRNIEKGEKEKLISFSEDNSTNPKQLIP